MDQPSLTKPVVLGTLGVVAILPWILTGGSQVFLAPALLFGNPLLVLSLVTLYTSLTRADRRKPATPDRQTLVRHGKAA